MTDETSNRDKFFDALDESFGSMLDAISSGNERGYRFSKRLIREVEQGQKEVAQLGRRAARAPRDMSGIREASVDLARRASSNSADLAREWMNGATEAGEEVRETARKVVRANRAAAQALGSAVQSAAGDLAERASTRRAPAETKKPPARKPARSDGPSATS